MDETTQQNAALVEEAAAAAASMQDQAASLARVVSVFRLHEASRANGVPMSTAAPSPALRKQIAASPKAKRAVKREPELTASEEC